MVVEVTRYRLLDPTVEPVEASGAMAPRTGDLSGLTVGLLANGKRNSDKLLDILSTLISERYAVREFVAKNKRNASAPAPKAIVDELLERCDVIITASGD
ncbi:MAG: hypothetical protein ACE5IG_01730 [Dehalococcoidia bacterium]